MWINGDIMIPIHQYLSENKVYCPKLMRVINTEKHKKIIVKKFKQLNAKCRSDELIGFSYNYIATTIKAKNGIKKIEAIDLLCKILKLNRTDIIKGETCMYINKTVVK